MTQDELDNIRDLTYGVTSWIAPTVKMPPENTRVLVAIVKSHLYTVRIMRCTRREITDFNSPLCFKTKSDDEKVLGWLPLPMLPLNEKDYVNEE